MPPLGLLINRVSTGVPQDGSGAITLSTPVQYRVFQRSTPTQGAIAITGTYTGNPSAIEASFNGGAWQTIDSDLSGGTFSGTLTGQTPGQGTLSVRFANGITIIASRANIGIGDIFVIGGQSNAVGMAESLQSYSHATLKACRFGNNYQWSELADPVDSASGQVDDVSQDDVPYGSCWPRVATHYLASQSCPVAFVPCALGGSAMESWQPGANHQDRTTLYGSMVYRALQTGAKCVLWWQGEEDAIRATSQAQYNTWLDTLANSINADLGVKLMPCTVELLNDAPWIYSTTNVNNAIIAAWGDNSNVLAGPDFSATDWGGAHYPASWCNTIGDAWWGALQSAFGWS